LRLKISTGTLEKPSRVDELRKDIARMKTILNDRKKNGGEK
jgi:ribosomal protein L29